MPQLVVNMEVDLQNKDCRLTGVPFTSEKILQESSFFKNSKYKFINDKPKSEQSATIVWNMLEDIEPKPLIWNIFPFHPFYGKEHSNNRTPNKSELELGTIFLKKLQKIFNITIIAAIGRKPESKLKELNVKYQYVRHPAFAGKYKFIEGMSKIFEMVMNY